MEGLCIFFGGVVVGCILAGMFFHRLYRDTREELRIIKGQLRG